MDLTRALLFDYFSFEPFKCHFKFSFILVLDDEMYRNIKVEHMQIAS